MTHRTQFDAVAPSSVDTVPKLLWMHADRSPDLPSIREKEFGIWQTYSWLYSRTIVSRMAAGLKSQGFQRGWRAALIGSNRPQLYWATTAVQSLGGIPVPLYNDSASDELRYVLEHSEAQVVFVEDQEQADKVLSLTADGSSIRQIVYVDPRGMWSYADPALQSLEELCGLGDALLAADPSIVEREVAGGRATDLSIVCYTSGTTGRPKGVMLSYANLLAVAGETARLEALTPSDVVLAYLPMAWIGDHFYSHVQSALVGFPVHCPESPDTVMSDLREVGPTYFFGPPRVFEAILTDVSIRMDNASWVKRTLFHHFMEVARQAGVDLLEGRRVGLAARARYAIGNLLVYTPLKNTLGLRRIRTAYTAGEALGPEIFDFFRSLGINVKQVYGQTESSVYVCMHRNGDVLSETVGPAAPGVEVRVDPRGEVVYRGPGVFDGYFKDDDATRATKDSDGWVHSGDAGVITSAGHLRIIDRAKDVGRLLDGTLFAPKYLENRLKFSPRIKEAVAFGHERPFVAALINIEMDAVGNWAERNGLPYTSYAHLASLEPVKALIAEAVANANARLSQEESLAGSQIRRFIILHKELDADDGELTRTRKLRRRVIADRYKTLIDALYSDADHVDVTLDVLLEDGRTTSTRANLKIVTVDRAPDRSATVH